MKISIASSDGIVINEHFGRATKFYVYEVEENIISLLDIRTGLPFCDCGEHEDLRLNKAIELIEDCDYVFVSQIGKGAEYALSERGIKPVCVRGYIGDVLQRMNKNYKYMNNQKEVKLNDWT